MANITTILLHYKRVKNLREIIAAIRAQSEKSLIWLWDNSCDAPSGLDVDVRVSSSYNFNCQPRFWLGGYVKTEYIFTQDDDFKVVNNDLFMELLSVSQKYSDYFIGVKGKVFGEWSDKVRPYQHNTGWTGEGVCDMVNTGLCFFRTELLNKLPFNPFVNSLRTVTENDYKYGDDMYVSSFQKCYAFPYEEKKHVIRLDECGKKLSGNTEHMDVRNKLCARYWKCGR